MVIDIDQSLIQTRIGCFKNSSGMLITLGKTVQTVVNFHEALCANKLVHADDELNESLLTSQLVQNTRITSVILGVNF